ncbi:MAG: nuclear transport factor 2 family protein [Mycobacterium sp.]|uniref:nuclear transport factor 2 family protein n=1 Tax=Mycobacterium sp. TaxID=1785 RepID=UPI001EB1CB40|nr:nuclear transport factor 2 family protein [Mycobacterium sp.]MBW0018061.1 nuclear transport factor 2 family protein [Mycobacterium sp.]
MKDDLVGLVRELADKQQITEVLYRIARGTDRGDVDLYASGFHDDGTDYHGLANGPVRNIVANLARSPLLLTQHSISNVLIDLDGDTARVESYFTSFHQRRDDRDQLHDEIVRGRYWDRFERRAACWKIARRVVLWDWSRVEPSGQSWFDQIRQRSGADDKFIFGRRDREDMTYTDVLPFDADE